MGNKLKKFFTFFIMSCIGYLVIKLYLLFKGLIELDKTLPQYLGNIIGDMPIVSINASFNNITITVKYEEEVIKKNEDLENIVKDYVKDFYPIFKRAHLKIIIDNIKNETENSSPAEKK